MSSITCGWLAAVDGGLRVGHQYLNVGVSAGLLGLGRPVDLAVDRLCARKARLVQSCKVLV